MSSLQNSRSEIMTRPGAGSSCKKGKEKSSPLPHHIGQCAQFRAVIISLLDSSPPPLSRTSTNWRAIAAVIISDSWQHLTQHRKSLLCSQFSSASFGTFGSFSAKRLLVWRARHPEENIRINFESTLRNIEKNYELKNLKKYRYTHGCDCMRIKRAQSSAPHRSIP